MNPVQILGMPQSPLVWAVRMAAEEKGIPAEMVMLMPHTPEITAIQPFGKIPAFKHGTVELAESRAIARYLDDISDANPLMPGDHVAAAKAEQWIMHYYTEYAPVLLARYIGPYFFPSGPNGTPDRAVIDAAIPLVGKALAALEKQLEGKTFVAGAFTFADCLYGPILHYVSVLPEGGKMVAASPNVAAYLARLSARPAFKATFPPPMPNRAAA
jgi:glutathione S-transferase